MVVRSGRAPLVPYTVMSPVTRPVPGSTNTARDSPRSSAGSANITRVVPPSDAGRTFTGESGEPIERRAASTCSSRLRGCAEAVPVSASA